MYRHVPLRPANFFILVDIGFHCVAQTGLELPSSGDPPALASESAGITGVSHCAWPLLKILDSGVWVRVCSVGVLCDDEVCASNISIPKE